MAMGKCCCLVLIAIVALVIAGVSIGVPLANKAKAKANELQESAADKACRATSYPATCSQTLASGNYTADSKGITRYSLQSSKTGVNSTLLWIKRLNGTNSNITAAVEVCVEVLELSLEQLEAAITVLGDSNRTTSKETMNDLKSWVSAAMELHTTCIYALAEMSPEESTRLEQDSAHTEQLLSNALAFINALATFGDKIGNWKLTGFSIPSGINISDLAGESIPTVPGFHNRRLLSSTNNLPEWMDAQTKRHLLQATTYDVVVANDGSGNFTTIQEAVNAYKKNSARLVIYIKAGKYNEQVIVPKTAKNLMFIGDGDDTIITGSRSVALTQGMTTFKSATLIVSGDGFVGRSFKVENTAGAEGHQAVAFRGTARLIAMYQVTFDSYQDTLYAHSFRQFYRECTIYGTVDFIFGNAEASFQDCRIIAKRSTLLGQQNTYTAQGRFDPQMTTGFSFQNCVFDGTVDLKGNTTSYKTFLGRPWKAYSVAVLLKSEVLAHVDPLGWLPWNATTFGLYTSFFAEYQSFGTGSDISKRVDWSHQIISAGSAQKYQANNLVGAGSWVPSYNIPLTTTL